MSLSLPLDLQKGQEKWELQDLREKVEETSKLRKLELLE